MIEDDGNHFCCTGCQGVFHLLQDSGLDSFYDKLGKTSLSPALHNFTPSSDFDSKAFYEQFVTIDSDGFCEVSLIIEHIHCAACVWLNEKALYNLDGVVEVYINYTNNKAKITYDQEVIELSHIIEMIRSIGYDAYAYDSSVLEQKAQKERREYYLKIVAAVVALMNIMIISTAQYAGMFSGMGQNVRTILNVGGWLLATGVLFYSGWVFFRGSYYAIKRKRVNMDVLVATGATLTYLYSIYLTIFTDQEAYFDSVIMIITFILVGKFLEVLSRKGVADTLDTLHKHRPSQAILLQDGKQISISVNDISVGDILLLRAGERAGVDGVLVHGESSFDESSLTGESRAIHKCVGDEIISGTTNIDGIIHFRATKEFRHSTLSVILDLLERSLAKKPKIEQLANRLSEHFSTAILLLSLITFIAWWLYPHDFETAFMVGISVIIIACPCALALATPVATLIGVLEGAKDGILFKKAAQLETLAQINTVVLDKTGTITTGLLEVVHEELDSAFDSHHLTLLNSLLKSSKHPVALGVSRHITTNTAYELQNVEQISSKGIMATYSGDTLLGGSLDLMRQLGIDIESKGSHTEFYFAINSKVVAYFGLDDTLKDDSIKAISNMRALNLKVIMLTGDNDKVASRVAKSVGVDEFKSSLTPEQKADYINALQQDGNRVIMAGDGVNDILALSCAEIGIAMGHGSDIAIDVSDIVLLNNSLTSLHRSIKLSRATFRVIKQNLSISLLYNALTIPLAMAGYIIPLVAAISMSLSSLLVVANSMRLRHIARKD